MRLVAETVNIIIRINRLKNKIAFHGTFPFLHFAKRLSAQYSFEYKLQTSIVLCILIPIFTRCHVTKLIFHKTIERFHEHGHELRISINKKKETRN